MALSSYPDPAKSNITGDDITTDIDNLTRISLAVIEKEKFGPLYAINTSGDDDLYIKGGVHVTIDNETSLSIPNTWVPLNLCDQAPREKILSSTNFRNVIRKGLLTLVAAADVELLYDYYPEVKKEADTVNKNLTSSTLEDLQRKEKRKVNAEIKEESSMVKEIIGSEFDDAQKYTAIMNKRTSFTPADWRYILKNSTSQKIVKLAANMLKN